MIQKSSEKCSDNYSCIYCNYTTSRKSQYERHILTLKHKKRQNDTNDTKSGNLNSVDFMCSCGKRYTHKPNLYRHQKKCNKYDKYDKYDNDYDLSNCTIVANKLTNDLILKLVQENSEIKSMLFKQFESIQEQQKFVQTENKELRNQINELIPKVGNTVNNTINSKQKLNINIFLNEQCKDALTINEFIDKIKISLDDLMLTKTKGLTEGVSNIFIENMNKLSLYERPMHCTDAKRETVYINSAGGPDTPQGWLRDEENKNFRIVINQIGHVQRQNLNKWIEEHPNWQKNSDEQEEYMKLVRNCTDDFKEDKIIKRLCNNIYLNPDNSF
jgi:hypothetical protein